MAFFCIHCKSEIDPKFKACPYCGEAITDFLRRHLETPIDGKYQILSRLGVGGMGEVYKVLHVHLNSIRVIKLMRANIATDPGAHERFLREARLATKIHHPNVATLFDFSTLADGSFYMVWEYIEGINLHELISQRGPLSPSYAARIASQALMGLDSIHRAGIVHRDVSPENLMITRDDDGEERVKIIDLGIAKSSSSDDNNTKTGMFVGKWKYCSPEHLGMLPAGERIDGRADLYSFGIVIYEMLTGVPPFQADTPHAYLMMHSQTRPRSLSEVNPKAGVSPELEALVFRALEKDRNRRFATAREFGHALDAIAPSLAGLPGAPPPPPKAAEVTNEATRVMERARVAHDAATVMSIAQDSPTIATKKPLDHGPIDAPPAEPRHSSVLPMIAILVVIALAVGGWFVLQKREPEPAPPVAQVAPAPIVKPGRLGINAFPWANVTSIRNLDSGANVALAGALVTPTPVDLPPGRYEVTLANPQFDTPITRTVALDAGEDETLNVTFRDPASATVPDFGVTR
ncbi:MAG TPA: protein kinase [Thermoanaerobaculia bacterium]|jgi:serine/threonine-protein kinase|nr:protein kinase [Thermoanaerobaculia bacterium]